MKSLLSKDARGSAVLPFVIVVPFLILITTYYMNLTVSSFRLARGDQLQTHAQFATDAGVDISLREINLNGDWTGTSEMDESDVNDEVELHNNGNIRTTYETTVESPDDDNKIIVSTGRSYFPASSEEPSSTITVRIGLRPVRAGEFSVVSGVGGLFMSNSSKIVGGAVLINGSIDMRNSAQIGLSTNPVTVDVAHQNCPVSPDSTYPQLCDSGENGEPVSIQHPAQIFGTVKANNQTDGSRMSSLGLVSPLCLLPSTEINCVDPLDLPNHNRSEQKTNVTNPSGSNDSYHKNCESNNTTRLWPARLKINGDVTIGRSCKIILEGDVWITGSLTVENSGQIVPSDSISLGGQNTVDENMPTIMVDGASGVVVRNSAELASNTNEIGMKVVTYWSNASCSPDCGDVTGSDLYSSQNERTIVMQNNTQAPNTMLYARWSQVELANGGSIGAVVGQTVRLSNSATITFGTPVTGAEGSSFWIINDYRRIFNP